MENIPLIEFILPKKLMYHHFEKLKNNNFETPVEIGIYFQVVIRLLERIEHEEYHPKWKEHWKTIQLEGALNQKIKDKLKWLGVQESNGVLNSINGEQKCCFGLNFKFSTNQEIFLNEFMMWGTFAALWCCEYEDTNLKEDIDNFLDKQLINLPESIYNFRCSLRGKKKFITLFWDTPDRMPPKLTPTSLGI